MASFVVDASVSIAWLLEDQGSQFTETWLMKIVDHDFWVPSLWTLECVNVLTVAARRGKLTLAKKRELLSVAEGLPLRVDDALPSLSRVARLAEDHNLSAYDAAYLELALKTGYPLVTRDRALVAAAQAVKHPVETDAG